ncbi:hypothetical protein EG68_02042 [Paragonimus skrjabini miyazakii]|uniref:Uncharacterized protein n=1 Tax=Paragonimus skrjabini miyazakii TaxID=59628 RepID=A0A8S9Z4Q6_9TREM|nr:hypothetical protein EG68_02042 [Paragonimus skrjabini miyazakii]
MLKIPFDFHWIFFLGFVFSFQRDVRSTNGAFEFLNGWSFWSVPLSASHWHVYDLIIQAPLQTVWIINGPVSGIMLSSLKRRLTQSRNKHQSSFTAVRSSERQQRTKPNETMESSHYECFLLWIPYLLLLTPGLVGFPY